MNILGFYNCFQIFQNKTECPNQCILISLCYNTTPCNFYDRGKMCKIQQWRHIDCQSLQSRLHCVFCLLLIQSTHMKKLLLSPYLHCVCSVIFCYSRIGMHFFYILFIYFLVHIWFSGSTQVIITMYRGNTRIKYPRLCEQCHSIRPSREPD